MIMVDGWLDGGAALQLKRDSTSCFKCTQKSARRENCARNEFSIVQGFGKGPHVMSYPPISIQRSLASALYLFPPLEANWSHLKHSDHF